MHHSIQINMRYELLYNTRKTKGVSQEEMAELVGMEQTTYSRKERGQSTITDSEWERFAKALEVPVEDIKEKQELIKNENCNFYDNAIGIQYVNLPHEMYDVLLKYIQKLENENNGFRKI